MTVKYLFVAQLNNINDLLWNLNISCMCTENIVLFVFDIIYAEE